MITQESLRRAENERAQMQAQLAQRVTVEDVERARDQAHSEAFDQARSLVAAAQAETAMACKAAKQAEEEAGRAVSQAKHEAQEATSASFGRLQRQHTLECEALRRVFLKSLQEVEGSSQEAHEVHKRVLQATRKRAAQMLSEKDRQMAAARQLSCKGAGTPKRSGTPAAYKNEAGTSSTLISVAVGTDSEWPDDKRPNAKRPEMAEREAADCEVKRRDTAAMEALARVAMQGEASEGGDGVLSHFAQRIVQMEKELEMSRHRGNVAVEASEHSARQTAALQKRLAQQQRLLKRLQGDAADPEYIHNVMFQFLTLPEGERLPLLPVLSALFGFSDREVAAVRRAHATRPQPASEWLWGRAASSGTSSGPSLKACRSAAAIGRTTPTPTPLKLTTPEVANHHANGSLAAHPAATSQGVACQVRESLASVVTSETACAEDEDVLALHKKVRKLLWLLKCANEEIRRLQNEHGRPA